MGDVSSRFLSKNIDSLIGLGVPETELLNVVPGGRPALGNPLARFDGNILIEVLNVAEAGFAKICGKALTLAFAMSLLYRNSG